jgi:hypothetical protein
LKVIRRYWVGLQYIEELYTRDITSCNPLKVNWRFGGTCCLRGWSISHESWLLHAGFLLGLLFNPKDEGVMYFRNVGWPSTDYIALYRIHYCRCENLKSYIALYGRIVGFYHSLSSIFHNLLFILFSAFRSSNINAIAVILDRNPTIIHCSTVRHSTFVHIKK